MRSLFFQFLASFVLATPTALGATGPFTIAQVMSAPFASSLIPAPTGGTVAWLLNERGRRNVWVASAPDWQGRNITNFNADDGQEINDLTWSPDGKSLLFARGGDFEMGRDNPNPASNPDKPEQAIWMVRLDGSPAKKITEGHGPAISPKGDTVAFLRGGQIFTMSSSGEGVKSAVNLKGSATGLLWSPDGTALAFVSGRGDHSFLVVYTPADRSLRYLDPTVDKDSNPVWSPDSSRVAYLRIPAMSRPFAFGPQREAQPWSIHVADSKTGVAREVFHAKRGPGSVFHQIVAEHQIFWTAGDRLIFPWEQNGWCHLYSLPERGDQPVELTPGEGEVEHAAMAADRNTIYYSTNIKDIDRRHIWSVDPAGGQSPQPVTEGENIEWEPAPAADGSALAFLASGYNEKAHAMLRTRNGAYKALAPDTTPVEFPSTALVRPQPVTITAADGMELHGQIFLPSGTRGRQQHHPALIFFHGGSRRQMLLGFHYMYYYSNAYALNQYFANRGYVVLSVNYRSGVGYGLNFREALNYGATGASEFNDVVGAGLYLKSRSDVDPRRIGVWGGSYGGYLTALGLARASDLFAAGVDFHGVHDWNEVIENFVPAYDSKRQAEVARLAFESSPLASVKSWKSPVLLIHGDDDRNVPFSQTVKLVEALRQQRVDFEELVIPDEIHDFLMHQHWVKAYNATADFFARKLGANAKVAQAP
ncbi:MAG: S9 family peptidase [Bryobacteraceae bacterium]